MQVELDKIPQRHRELASTWQPGQRWETMVVITRDGPLPVDKQMWVPVGDGGYAQPVWDDYQEYRRIS